jgi:hypothetical protein
MLKLEPAAFDAGAKLRRLRRRPDDGDFDAVRMRLVIRADDAEREHDHEEDRDSQGAQRESRLRALRLLHGGVGWPVVRHPGPPLAASSVVGWPLP